MVRDISTMRGRGSGGEGRTARLVGRAVRPATGLEEREREREREIVLSRAGAVGKSTLSLSLYFSSLLTFLS